MAIDKTRSKQFRSVYLMQFHSIAPEHTQGREVFHIVSHACIFGVCVREKEPARFTASFALVAELCLVKRQLRRWCVAGRRHG